MKDLFQTPELLPSEVRAIVEKYNLLHEQIPDNEICINMLAELKPLGYTFDYGLDYEPTNLRKVEELYTSNVLINKVELASVLAHRQVRNHVEAHDIYEDTDEGTIYTGEAQNIFDEYYDIYFTEIEAIAIK